MSPATAPPWKAFGFHVVADNPPRAVADCASKRPGDPVYNDPLQINEDIANAKLIAAVHDLRAACEVGLAAVFGCSVIECQGRGFLDCKPCTARALMRAALKKASGE